MSAAHEQNAQKKAGFLILEDASNPDGIEFPGFLFGAEVSSATIRAGRKQSTDKGYGEVVFNTSMTGYQEILTDPSYYGQMICMTVPHVGNTGVNIEDPESVRPWCAGFIVHEECSHPSNWRAKGSLHDFLSRTGVPAISGIDTRSLTRHLRSRGVVRGVILPAEQRSEARQLLAELPPFEGRDLIGEVTTSKPYAWSSVPTPEVTPGVELSTTPYVTRFKGPYKVVAVDFGVKHNLLRSLAHFGCEVEVVPAKMSSAEILSRKPDGVFLSNGPGDPAAAPYAVETVRDLVGKVPVFGVCMGHQILSLAMGAKTYKLKFGHRGGNQPVLEKETGRVEISSQNHGYAVDASSLPKGVEVTHINLNDRTVEGIRVAGKDAFSVQYHPEACPGPHDSMVLFERFVETMDKRKR